MKGTTIIVIEDITISVVEAAAAAAAEIMSNKSEERVKACHSSRLKVKLKVSIIQKFKMIYSRTRCWKAKIKVGTAYCRSAS